MGMLDDLFRLGKAGMQQSATTDYAANLKASADLAEAYARGDLEGTHGSASANPFTNMSMYASMMPGTATVIDLVDTGKRLDVDTIYAVELEVVVPDQPPYRTIYKTVIAAPALIHWRVGSSMPVRVSPTDPTALMLG